MAISDECKFIVAERSHVAKPGSSYSLIAKSNCRYESGQCDLVNSDFKLTIRPDQLFSRQTTLTRRKSKKMGTFCISQKCRMSPFCSIGGEGGIRTLEGLQTLAGFQDQCIQPLCHLSGAGFCAANCACKRTETQYICLRWKNASELLNKYSRKSCEVTDINTNYVLAILGRRKLC